MGKGISNSYKNIQMAVYFYCYTLLAFFIPYLILGQGQNIGDAFKDNTILFLSMIALVLGAIAAGVIGAIITKKYLSATGLSALTYIITFFVLSSYYKRVKLPYVNEELAVSFDSMMLIIVTALVVFVFIGDLIVFVFRLLKEKRQEIKS